MDLDDGKRNIRDGIRLKAWRHLTIRFSSIRNSSTLVSIVKMHSKIGNMLLFHKIFLSSFINCSILLFVLLNLQIYELVIGS